MANYKPVAKNLPCLFDGLLRDIQKVCWPYVKPNQINVGGHASGIAAAEKIRLFSEYFLNYLHYVIFRRVFTL